MNFEEKERVEYTKNTLFEMVLQARFPKIMKISTEEPVEFQDSIRKQYPESKISAPELPSDIPDDIRNIIMSNHKTNIFISEDGNWKVGLSNEFIALTNIGNYTNYSEFQDRLNFLLITFFKIYTPSYFNRVGLRYRNIANNSVFKITNCNVKEFIPDYIAPELTLKGVSKDIKAFEKFMQFTDDNCTANVTLSLNNFSGKFGQNQITNEESYLIDIDCFTETKQREVNDVITCAKTFHSNIWNIFQWSITPKLHSAMESKKP